uniref:Uncharacterized protein n=1 Tax=Arundo donax TaxID=35708 RepID=A0A0A8YZ52_ARUDO
MGQFGSLPICFFTSQRQSVLTAVQQFVYGLLGSKNPFFPSLSF